MGGWVGLLLQGAGCTVMQEGHRTHRAQVWTFCSDCHEGQREESAPSLPISI